MNGDKGMNPDEQALRAIVTQLVDAWNAGDAAGFAAPFSDDAIFIHVYGGQLDGRAAIEGAHHRILTTFYKGSRNHYDVRSVRFPRPDVALVLLEAKLQFEEQGQPREIQARPTLVAVKDGGKWVIHAFQNTRITEMPGPPPGKP
jgi:uncharacterized protein (TIGR02246 family)